MNSNEFFFRIILKDNVLSYLYNNLPAPVEVKKFDTNSLQFKTISLLATLARNKQLTDDQLEVLGEQLYSVLLQEKMYDKLTKAIQANEAENCLIRIELLFQGQDRSYFEWPWEYIYRPDVEGENDINMFLTRNDKFLIVRHLLKEFGRSSLIKGDELRILFVASGPTIKTRKKKSKYPAIIYEGVYQTIKDITAQSANNEFPVRVTLAELIDAPQSRCTIEQFQEALKSKPHIIHFLAHGRFNENTKEAEILFMNKDDTEDWVSGDHLKTLMNASDDLKLIFLESCETGVLNRLNPISGLAQQLSDINVPSVIAMQSEIVQNDAHEFSQAFYKSLFAGRSVYGAMKDAIIHIRLRANAKNAFGIPVLYARDEGVLFRMPEIRKNKPPAIGSSDGGRPAMEEEQKKLNPEELSKQIEDKKKELEKLMAQMQQPAESGLMQAPAPEAKSLVQTKIDANKN